MSLKQNDEYREHQREMQAEAARTAQIAQDAIKHLYMGIHPDEIETEALDALVDWLSAYRKDRDYRELDRLPF